MGWRVFLMRVGSSGWNWFVNVWNHVGAITGTLALVGGLVLSFALRWWIVLVVLQSWWLSSASWVRFGYGKTRSFEQGPVARPSRI